MLYDSFGGPLQLGVVHVLAYLNIYLTDLNILNLMAWLSLHINGN